MLGIHLTGRDPVRHGLPVGADPRPVRREDVEDEGQRRRPARDDRRAGRRRRPVRAHPRGDARASTSGSGRRSSTTPGTSRTSSGTRPGSCWARGRRRSRRPQPGVAPDRSLLGPAERWILSRAAATVGEADRAFADYQFAELTRALYDGIWSEFCDWGLELAKVRLADASLPGRGPRGDVVDAGLGARHVPPAAPSGHAVRHRAAVGRAAPRGRRPGAADRRSAGRQPGSATPRRRPRSGRSSSSSGRSATPAPRRGSRRPRGCRCGWPCRRSWRPRSTALRPRDRAARPGAAAGGRPGSRGAGCGDGRRSLAVVAGGLEALVLLGGGGSGASSADADRARLEKELAEAEGYLAAARARLANDAFTSKAPAAVVEGARAREAELADQVERLRARLG